MNANVDQTEDPLRTGTWTPQELEYMDALIEEFSCGSLDDIPERTTLRGYVAKQLHCSVKRISKKMDGKAFNGGQRYKEQLHYTKEDVHARKMKLEGLRQRFLETLEKLGLPGSTKYKQEKAKDTVYQVSQRYTPHHPPHRRRLTNQPTASLGIPLQEEKRERLDHSKLVGAFARAGNTQSMNSSQAVASSTANTGNLSIPLCQERGGSQELSRLLESYVATGGNSLPNPTPRPAAATTPTMAGLDVSINRQNGKSQEVTQLIAQLVSSANTSNQQRNQGRASVSTAAVEGALFSHLVGGALDASKAHPQEALSPAPRNSNAPNGIQRHHATVPGLARWNMERPVLPSNGLPLLNGLHPTGSQALDSPALGNSFSASAVSHLSLPNNAGDQACPQGFWDPAAVPATFGSISQSAPVSWAAAVNAIQTQMASSQNEASNQAMSGALAAALQHSQHARNADEPDSKRPRFF